jgi:hypothetical protein
MHDNLKEALRIIRDTIRAAASDYSIVMEPTWLRRARDDLYRLERSQSDAAAK